MVLARVLLLGSFVSTAPVSAQTEAGSLETEVRRQQEQIRSLERLVSNQAETMARMQERLSRLEGGASAPSAIAAAIPAALPAAVAAVAAASTAAPVQAAAPSQVESRLDSVARNLGGFRFSGDFRYRFDMQLRSSNEAAGALQNIRNRYRVRLNVDKEIDPRFRFHLQFSTSPLNNIITNDQDFAALGAKHPFFISEAYVDYLPSSKLAFRVGRTEEIFADNMRFLWDDDLRLNGFHETVKLPLHAGFRSLELRAAQYILSNPNVAVLAPTSPYVTAGFAPGQKVRAANLFHQGLVLATDREKHWVHQLSADMEVYRHPNQIQLASLPAGFPVLVSSGLGLALSGPIGGSGNATTTAGGAIYRAQHYQIARVAYRLESKGVPLGARQVPAFFDLQLSRNVGTASLRDALIASLNLGSVRKGGDMRLLYQFSIKDANSLVSQFTDDDLGTGTGVNIRVHAVRFDLGLARFLQWQNLVFFQDARRPSNAADRFFVPLPRGANTTYRYLGQLAFTF